MTTSMATYNTPKPRVTLPTFGLMGPDFVYVPAAQTDIRKTFARARASAASTAVLAHGTVSSIAANK